MQADPSAPDGFGFGLFLVLNCKLMQKKASASEYKRSRSCFPTDGNGVAKQDPGRVGGREEGLRETEVHKFHK